MCWLTLTYQQYYAKRYKSNRHKRSGWPHHSICGLLISSSFWYGTSSCYSHCPWPMVSWFNFPKRKISRFLPKPVRDGFLTAQNIGGNKCPIDLFGLLKQSIGFNNQSLPLEITTNFWRKLNVRSNNIIFLIILFWDWKWLYNQSSSNGTFLSSPAIISFFTTGIHSTSHYNSAISLTIETIYAFRFWKPKN